MTKFAVSAWDSNLTLKENADKIGLCYNYAAELARANSLAYKRKKGAGQFRTQVYSPDEIPKGVTIQQFKINNMKLGNNQWFGGEGPD